MPDPSEPIRPMPVFSTGRWPGGGASRPPDPPSGGPGAPFFERGPRRLLALLAFAAVVAVVVAFAVVWKSQPRSASADDIAMGLVVYQDGAGTQPAPCSGSGIGRKCQILTGGHFSIGVDATQPPGFPGYTAFQIVLNYNGVTLFNKTGLTESAYPCFHDLGSETKGDGYYLLNCKIGDPGITSTGRLAKIQFDCPDTPTGAQIDLVAGGPLGSAYTHPGVVGPVIEYIKAVFEKNGVGIGDSVHVNCVTPTPTPTKTPTKTNTPTKTPTKSPTPTSTPTNTSTPTGTSSPTSTLTPTGTEEGVTSTPEPSSTNTPTNTATNTPTNTPTNTQPPPTPTRTNTPPGSTSTPMSTNTPPVATGTVGIVTSTPEPETSTPTPTGPGVTITLPPTSTPGGPTETPTQTFISQVSPATVAPATNTPFSSFLPSAGTGSGGRAFNVQLLLVIAVSLATGVLAFRYVASLGSREG